MSLLSNIKSDWINARKARQTVEASVLGTLIGAIETKSKTFNPARDLTDAEILAEVKKMLMGVVETGKLLPVGDARLEANGIEKVCLEKYMPKQMSEAEIEAFASEKKAGGMNLGQVMAALKTERPGMYDGRMASEVVKRVLAG